MNAAHIVGGVLVDKFLNTANESNTYQLTLKIYRDCSPGTRAAAFDSRSFFLLGNQIIPISTKKFHLGYMLLKSSGLFHRIFV